jgi:hypothetical protein
MIEFLLNYPTFPTDEDNYLHAHLWRTNNPTNKRAEIECSYTNLTKSCAMFFPIFKKKFNCLLYWYNCSRFRMIFTWTQLSICAPVIPTSRKWTSHSTSRDLLLLLGGGPVTGVFHKFAFCLTRTFQCQNGVFWVVTPCGSCKNRRFGGTWRLLHQGDKNRCEEIAAYVGC